jgi:hypothetical protein
MKHNNYWYTGACMMIFMAGFGHGAFICKIMAGMMWSTWAWHLWQWLPLLLGAVGFAVVGIIVDYRISLDYFKISFLTNRMWDYHSLFGWIGRALIPFALAACGYVIGLEVFR